MDRKRLLTCLLALVAGGAAARADDRDPESREGAAPAPEVGTEVGKRLPRFEAELLDLRGEEEKKASFDSHANDEPTAYVFMSKTCPWCDKYEQRLTSFSKSFGEKGLRFVVVYPMTKTPEAAKKEYHRKSGFAAPMINDKDASIAKKLGVTKTPEIVLTDKSGKIVYRGGIDDSPLDASKVEKAYFRDACEDVLAGREVRVTTAPLYG